MDPDERFRIALWRMNILGPLVSARLERGERRVYFEEAAARTHERPDGALVRVTAATVERWYHAYRKGGVHALAPKPRKDRGVSRAIAPDVAEQVVALKQDKPRRTIEQITGALEHAKVVRRGQLARSTVHRLLRSRSLSTRPPRLEQSERRSSLPLHAGDLWMGDAMHGPQVACQDGQRRKAYLLTQLDAATRFIVHSEFFLSEDARHHEAGLRTAIERYGLPRTYYVDRGAAYVADSLRAICAELGVRLVHTSPGDCEAKGAIERWHRTWRDGLEHELPHALSLAELNRRHWADRNIIPLPRRGCADHLEASARRGTAILGLVRGATGGVPADGATSARMMVGAKAQGRLRASALGVAYSSAVDLASEARPSASIHCQ